MGNECSRSTVNLESEAVLFPEPSKQLERPTARALLEDSTLAGSNRAIPIEGPKNRMLRSIIDLKVSSIEGVGESKVVKYVDGSIYSGTILNDKKNGSGVLQDKFGNHYDGEFKNDRLDGYGMFRTSEGTTFKGYWRNDLQHGFGEENWPDGSSYRGSYVLGMKHGEGVYRWDDGSEYNGKWNQGVMEGFVG